MKDLFKKYNKAYDKLNKLTKQLIQKLYEEQIQIYVGYNFGREEFYGVLEPATDNKWIIRMTPNKWMFIHNSDIAAIDEYEGSYFIQLN